MNLNHFLKSDREKAEDLYKSLQFIAFELLEDVVKKGDFDGCITLANAIVDHSRDLKKMQHPEQVVELHEIASKFAKKGLDVTAVKRNVH
ncbi:YqaH family protein [Bacillus paralicheniformis]|uniref:YqaH family protein n=1 Tax=Bacillus paralicheniformis TaxID=1648923 RepID=UPI002DB5DE73|nr:YqaH family protein [Bacillus paralicheniformis]MEC2212603.1 YqaH family protein [Bacillus paralicheniformis]